MEKESTLGILIVADDPLTRGGLARLLEGEPTCSVLAAVDSGPALDDALEIHSPDVLLWDLGWDEEEQLERLAVVDEGEIPILALLADREFAGEVWTAGARGLVRRTVDAEQLRSGLFAVHQGFALLDQSLTTPTFPRRGEPAGVPADGLTAREREVVELLAEGHTNRAIAEQLSISEYTVKFHVNAILRKLDAQSRTEAAIQAVRLGLISL